MIKVSDQNKQLTSISGIIIYYKKILTYVQFSTSFVVKFCIFAALFKNPVPNLFKYTK